jgi:hypothetical protein
MATHSTLFTFPGLLAFVAMCGSLVYLLATVARLA